MRKINLNNRKIIVLLSFLAITMLVLNFSGFSENIKNFFFVISTPIQQHFWQAGQNISNFFTNAFKGNIFKDELQSLKLENQELLYQIALLKELEEENQSLREALDLGLEEDFQLIQGRVIGKDSFTDTVLINKGAKDGLLKRQPVITAEKVLVGEIGQVYHNFSEVILISNQKSSFDAKVIDSETFGIIKGKGRFNLYFELIPKDKEVAVNDVVITSLLGGVFPVGLLVGEIKAVEKSALEPFQQAEINPFFEIKELDYLFVIKKF